MKSYQKKSQAITTEKETELNILVFINTIHLNKQDFYASYFDSHLYGDVELSFKKEKDCLFGYCLTTFKNNGRIIEYIFSEHGFEKLDSVVFNNDN